MTSVQSSLGGFFLPLMVLLVFVVIGLVGAAMARRYKKVAPNKALVFSGKKYNVKGPDGQVRKQGFMVLGGGGKVLIPFVEQVEELTTSMFQVQLAETKIPNVDNVPLNVKGLAMCKISTLQEDLESAAKAFLGKTDQIADMTKNVLLGHLRSIIGKMTVDELIRNRDKFNTQVSDESKGDLKRMGIEISTLVIQDISDINGYIDALGEGKTAEVKRDAKIRVAQAVRDSDIAVAEATRESQIKTTLAQKEGATAAAQNQALIFEAQKERDLKIANFKSEVDARNAQAAQAGPLSNAQAIKAVKVATAEAEAAEKEAQAEVQRKEAIRREEELIATDLKKADVDKRSVIVRAEGVKQAAILEAEGNRQAAIFEGEGQASRSLAILKAEAEGNAAKELAMLKARAEGEAMKIELEGKAKGAAIAAALNAEAEGLEKKAEAMRKLEETGRTITILEKLPPVIEALGEALSKVAKETFQGIAAPLANIDDIKIIDFGGSGNGETGLNRFANLGPQMIMKFIAMAKSGGLDLKGLLGKFGLNSDELIGLLGSAANPPSAETEAPAKPAK